MKNRLQFLHCNKLFATAEEAKQFIENRIDSAKQYSLYAEPIVLRYGDEQNPNVLVGIGSKGDGNTPGNANNRIFYIDGASIEKQISELSDTVESVIGQLTLVGEDTDTVDMTVERTDDGTKVKADVNVAEMQIIDNIVRNNIIKSTSDGLFAFVGLSFDNETSSLVFDVNGEKTMIPIPEEEHLTEGHYVYEGADAENLILTTNKGNEIKINLEKLIEEWTVEEDPASPIVLTKEHVIDGNGAHADDWQDILRANVRIAPDDLVSDNILEKDASGKYLFVKGTARNITFWKDGVKTNVQDALAEMDGKVSEVDNNIIVSKRDGVYANVTLEYNKAQNKLKLVTTDKLNGRRETEIELSGTEILDDASYDSSTESIVLRFITAKGEYKTVSIPVSDIVTEWTVDNTNASVTLTKNRDVSGTDTLTANVNVSDDPNSILKIDNHHNLYVSNQSSGIRYNETTTVKAALDDLYDKVADEEARATEAEAGLASNISVEAHERVEADTNLSNLISQVSGSVQTANSDIAQNTSDIEALENSLGELSGNSILDVEDTNTVDMTKTGNTVKADVKLASEQVIGKNMICTFNDGLFANVQLGFDSGTSKVSITYNGDANTKQEIDLSSLAINQDRSSIESIEYNKEDESLVITYKTNSGDIEVVSVNMRDLIDEWKVENRGHNVTLERTEVIDGADELSADVNISTARTNMIQVVHEDGVDCLMVSNTGLTELNNKVSELSAKTGSLDERVSENAENIEDIVQDVEDISSAVSRNADAIRNIMGTIPTFDSTSSINMSKDANNVVASELNVYGRAQNNILISDGNGVYASVDVSYNEASNTLTLKRSGYADKDIELTGVEVLENAYYDSENERIVLEFSTMSGLKKVYISASDLIREWTVNNDGNTVTLNKVRNGDPNSNTDILTANVNISERSGNMIQVIDNHLFVDGGSISSAITSSTEALQAEIDKIEESVGLNTDGTFTPDSTKEYLSGATSMAEADANLNDAIVKLYNNVKGSSSATIKVDEVEDAGENRLKAMIRLSGGPGQIPQSGMTITDIRSGELDADNALRVVDVENSIGLENNYNGLYLSSNWDCGTF